MGYQLWASPVTGHRRVGTRLSELQALFARGITVSSIMERLLSCEKDADAADISEILRIRDFDVVGVIEDETKKVIGFASARRLQTGTVREVMSVFGPNDLIAESTPLASVFEILDSRNHVFVLSENAVTGIVTRADLNKPPARIVLFALISLVEMHLTYWIRAEYPGESWLDPLEPRRLEKARQFQEERRRYNQELDLVDCLQLADKRDLVVDNRSLRRRLKMGGRKSSRKILRIGERLRDDLAHSQADVAGAVDDWADLIKFVRWSQDFLNVSDSLVDKHAEAAGGGYVDALHPPLA